MPNLCFVTFPATHYALKGEKILKKESIECKLIPIPREFSSSCGICMEIDPTDKEKVKALFEESRVKVEEFYER